MDESLHVAGDDVESQTRKAFENLELVLDAAGEVVTSVGKVTTYVVDLAENVDGYRTPWRETFDEPYPCYTLVDVDQLGSIADGELLVEIDAEVALTK